MYDFLPKVTFYISVSDLRSYLNNMELPHILKTAVSEMTPAIHFQDIQKQMAEEFNPLNI